jgi:hypothetical protein
MAGPQRNGRARKHRSASLPLDSDRPITTLLPRFRRRAPSFDQLYELESRGQMMTPYGIIHPTPAEYRILAFHRRQSWNLHRRASRYSQALQRRAGYLGVGYYIRLAWMIQKHIFDREQRRHENAAGMNGQQMAVGATTVNGVNGIGSQAPATTINGVNGTGPVNATTVNGVNGVNGTRPDEAAAQTNGV